MTPAILIAVAAVVFVGLGFLLYFLLRKKSVSPPHYTTKHGIAVWLSPQTEYLVKDMMEQWIDSLVAFWSTSQYWSLAQIQQTITKTRVYFLDLQKIAYQVNTEPAKYAYGLSKIEEKIIYIAALDNKGQIDQGRIERLVRHELSHFIVARMTNKWSNDEAHAFFKEVGLYGA